MTTRDHSGRSPGSEGIRTSDPGCSGQPLRRALRAGLSLAVSVAALALLMLPAAAQAGEQKLTAPDGATGDEFGRSAAIDGDTAVVGAPEHDGARGAVYVFTRNGAGWTQTAKLTASDRAAADKLGRSVAIDGDTIVAGAWGDDVGANTNQGSVYTFARSGASARTESAKLTASDGAGSDLLGISVAIDGDTIIAGASFDDIGANANQGSVYTFARNGAAARTQTAKLTASDGVADDELGGPGSIAIDGDTIVAGAQRDVIGANANQGSVYTFARSGAATRTQTAKLTASDGAAHDSLGGAVAIDGDTIVAGAHNVQVGANLYQGAVYTFASSGAATRHQTARLTASDGAFGDALGSSVAIDGDTIAAAAFGDDIGANSSQGSVYTFARSGSAARTQTAKLVAADGASQDSLGEALAIDGGTIIASTPFDDVGTATNQGSAYIFVVDDDGDGVLNRDDNCPLASNADQADQDGDGRGDACDADRDGDAVANSADNCPDASNGDQANQDGDAWGDVCDTDRDGDTVANASDNCPDTANAGQANQDGDTMGDACDADRDGDTVADASDNCPTVDNADQADRDADGTGDLCDSDRDGDGEANGSDNCPDAANADQADWDDDGRGDACDADRPPAQQITELAQTIEAIVVNPGTQNSLTKKLQAAVEAYNAGDIDSACSKLDSFIHEVRAQSGKKIPTAEADGLIADAERIKQLIGC